MTKKKTKIAILGSGPAGYSTAFLAADQGLEVTLIDKRGALGGTCLHEGCIPSKALLHIANIIRGAEQASDLGILFNPPQLDMPKIQSFRKNIIKKLSTGLTQLCRMRKINFIEANAHLTSHHTLNLIKSNQEKETLSFEQCVIATGARPKSFFNIDSCTQDIISSKEALELPEVPSRLLIIGGGYIGLEMATIFSNLGSQVTICEITANLLPGMDRDLVNIVEKEIRKKVKIFYSTKVESIKKNEKNIEVIFKNSFGETDTQFFDKILYAAGRIPNTDFINISCTKIETDESGFIQTNSFGQTKEKNIFAIGDVRGGLQLAHKATAEAQALVQTLTGKKTPLPQEKTIPCAVYTIPEIAFCGLSETQARKIFQDIKIIKNPWIASGRALSINQPNGLTKFIFDDKKKKVLGAGIAGDHASELIGSVSLAINLHAGAKHISETVFPHPTLMEMFREASENLLGKNPHAFKK